MASLKPPDWVVVYWIIWIMLFVVPEWYAVKHGNGGTLSHFIWWLIDVGGNGQRDAVRWLARFIVAGVTIWLPFHFLARFHWFK